MSPHFGALMGILLYDHIIGCNLKDDDEDEGDDQSIQDQSHVIPILERSSSSNRTGK